MRANWNGRLFATAGCVLLMLFVTLKALAQAYPTKPIRVIVPVGVGGPPDIAGRMLVQKMSESLGQAMVIENRMGAGGTIGGHLVVKSAPDGYTLGYAAFPFITIPLMFTKLPYDTAKDFQPVVQQIFGSNLLAVSPALPVKTVQALVDYARAQPGKLSYGSVGAGASQQLSIELLKKMTGTQIVQVTYKGMQQAITDVIAGQVHIVCENLPSILPHIRAERLRALGVTTLKRSSILPDIPTISESGVAGYEVAISSGYILPARTSRDIVLRLNIEINKALTSPSVAEKFAATGVVITGGTPEQFAEHLRRETAKWAEVIKTAGIKPQ